MPDIERVPEVIVPGKRLGRHIDHEALRSAQPFSRRAAVPVVSRIWTRNTPILDQGDVGACTGNAMTGALGTDPVFPALLAVQPHALLDEALALALYSQAEVIDGDGPYPPEDNGSTGSSVSKAAREDGFISGFNLYADLDSMLQALMDGPVIIGISWYTSFDTPAADGTIAIAPGATVRGGHEVLVREVDAANQALGADNSWGTSYGINGSFWLSYATMTQLFAEGADCAEPLPLGASIQPAPDISWVGKVRHWFAGC